MSRRALVAAVLAALLTAAAVASARAVSVGPASPVCVPRATAPVAGITLASSQPVAGHPRVTDLTFSSAALGGSVHADVLLPTGYDASGAVRYPVLYLLHGHGGNHTDWVSHDADAAVADLPAIVVMPDGGYDGWYSDWYGTDLDGHTPSPPPAWEAFHTTELLPWVDQHYPTVAARNGRAIAGLSMGGFGSMSYAARHPDLFVAAGEFSGAVDPDLAYPVGPVGLGAASNLPDRKPLDNCIWGDPVTQDVLWRDHNPTELARNLGGLSLFLTSGNGAPGRFDDPASPNPGAAATEFGVGQMNQSFDRALTAAGVGHTTDFYGNGTHSWPYWIDDLRHFASRMQAAFASPPAAPSAASFDFESARSSFSVWDWTFTTHRDVHEMTYLTGVGPTGLVATGSGTLHVDTAALYVAGGVYRLSGTGPAGSRSAVADSGGRLHFDVDLGPSHVTQQYLFGPQVESTFTHAAVGIHP